MAVPVLNLKLFVFLSLGQEQTIQSQLTKTSEAKKDAIENHTLSQISSPLSKLSGIFIFPV